MRWPRSLASKTSCDIELAWFGLVDDRAKSILIAYATR
jgi:hypothetical protein